MKALVGAFNQEKALVGAFSVIVKTDCETDGGVPSPLFIHADTAATRHKGSASRVNLRAIFTLYYVITASMLPLTGGNCGAAPLCWTAISYVIVSVSSPGANAEDIY